MKVLRQRDLVLEWLMEKPGERGEEEDYAGGEEARRYVVAEAA
jgi:hypothetical protein